MSAEYTLKPRGTADMRDDWLWVNVTAGIYYIKDTASLQAGKEVDLYILCREGGVKLGFAKLDSHETYIYAKANGETYSIPSQVLTGVFAKVMEVIHS